MNIWVRASSSAKTSTCVAEVNDFVYLLVFAERSGGGERVQTAGASESEICSLVLLAPRHDIFM